jgi:hypothetical protein
VDVSIRGNRLWDRENHTFTFTTSAIYVDIVRLIEWADLPEPVAQYIMMKATRKFVERSIGAADSSARQDEVDAKVVFEDFNADTGDYNMLTDSYSVARIMRREPSY